MRGLWALSFILGVFLLVAHAMVEKPEDEGEPEIAEDTPMEEGSEEAPEETAEGEEDEGNVDDVWQEEQLSSDQLKNMHSKIDDNKDGKISLAEVLDFSKTSRHAIVKKEVLVVFDQMDTNKDSKISVEELLESTFGHTPQEGELHPEMPAPEGEEAAEDARIEQEKELERQKFKVADKNGDGFLDKDELPAAFYPETHDGVLAITVAHSLKAKDKDGDGQLSPEEFWETTGGENEDTVAEQQADFEKLDTDKNGKLNLEELKKWESGAFHTHDAMTQLFEVADEDNDQHITAKELEDAKTALANSMATSHFVEWAEHYEL